MGIFSAAKFAAPGLNEDETSALLRPFQGRLAGSLAGAGNSGGLHEPV
jgi:hypothetical protein